MSIENERKGQNILKIWSIGKLLLIIGAIAIYSNLIINFIYILNHTILDKIPSQEFMELLEILLFSLIPIIGLPSISLFIYGVRNYYLKNSLRSLKMALAMFFFASFAINFSFFLGGGWIIGVIFSDLGLFIMLYSVLSSEISRSKEILNTDRIKSILTKKQKIIIATCLIVGIFLSYSVPTLINISAVPESLIPDAIGPSTEIPNHQNTFYILPIWEGGGVNLADDIWIMENMQEIVGGESYTGEGFIKIGRSVSCWYTNNIFNDSTGDFNNASLIYKLNLSAITNTPILFHMNGGNWGQLGSTFPVIEAMRENESNCQWDQEGYCHPIGNNPGPNDRFWSFWPESDWERFREKNIKQALEVIYNWWQENPDLLVGFSTDSEIHLIYHTFEEENEIRTGTRYKSYFDYNNKTIDQYRLWAQSNWTLTDFNTLCGTSFSSWVEVDAPRDSDVVGKKGDPWWEMWTDFRIWHVKEAGKRQCKWINESGFPRDMIWNHQILSEPGDDNARYQRADPLETSINEYCKVGVTRYGWISPEIWHSLGELGLQETDDEIPSWGIFEWNLWHQHEYWAYREMLNCIYQYGGHVICPNEWTNCSINEGLWIPGEPYDPELDDTPNYNPLEDCCQLKDEEGNCIKWVARHGNPQFLAALRDFVAIGQNYTRGSCPELRVNVMDVIFYDTYYNNFKFYNSDGLYIEGGLFLLCVIYASIIIDKIRKLNIRNNTKIE